MSTSKKATKTVSFAQLISAMKNCKYLLSSGKYVLELPLYFVNGKTFLTCYKEFLNLYEDLLQDEKVGEEIFNTVANLNKGLCNTIDEYLKGDIMSSYNIFCNTMNPIKGILPRRTINQGVFYRMRSDTELFDPIDFWHIPFNKRYLSQSERFSIEGYPILYLGYSKRVCELEISGGSLAKFNLLDSIENVLDLTLGQGEGQHLISDEDLMKTFPLIASCYVVPFYSILKQKEIKLKGVSFREEYIIPQFLTMYIRKELKANGIIYYSVKDPNLQTYGIGEDDLRNLALYTKHVEGEMYDEQLMKKFLITI